MFSQRNIFFTTKDVKLQPMLVNTVTHADVDKDTLGVSILVVPGAVVCRNAGDG